MAMMFSPYKMTDKEPQLAVGAAAAAARQASPVRFEVCSVAARGQGCGRHRQRTDVLEVDALSSKSFFDNCVHVNGLAVPRQP
mmetsp:Transcript_115727/g.373937  ORF Transcript_115727/g.373937 Transcript_115727/m.373937 type:complete len:83 (-) Transcript_115727:2766-3014(-)